MPTFSTIALDRLLDPGASELPSMSPTVRKKDIPDPSPGLERRNTTPFTADDPNFFTKRLDIPPPHPELRRHNTAEFKMAREKKTLLRPQISPALYATPEPSPIPDSPASSFPPSSPYIVNHKRRGPRLLKSFSEQNVAAFAAEMDGSESKLVNNGHGRSFSQEDVPRERQEERFDEKIVNGHVLKEGGIQINGSLGDVIAQEHGIHDSNGDVVGENGEMKVVISSSSERNGGEAEDFFDPLESTSFTSNADSEFYGAERSAKASTPVGEFFDAWEELSSESGRQAERSLADVETELQDMRLTFLMEMEKRKQAEETINSMRSQWQLLREKLRFVGLILPADLSVSLGDSQSDVGPTEEICRQIHLARFVSESIGRGIAKAEVEAEMETQLELKNFEVARLWDRLHYYETMNREMSHRNQEAIEIVRHERQKRRRRRTWVWGSIAAGITLGCTALAWSYFPGRQGSSSTNFLEASESDRNLQPKN